MHFTACQAECLEGRRVCWGRVRQREVKWESLDDTNRRQEGKEVVLLVVNDIPRVPLLPLLWVAEPHRAGTKVTHATTSRPGPAPEQERRKLYFQYPLSM